MSSVFGRTGAVGAQTGDYTTEQITETANRVIMTSAERAKLAGFVTVAEFGAVGDGVADDTVAFVAAAAYVVQHKKALRVPAATYLLKQAITFTNAPVALLGDGIGLSILKWTADAASLGISITSNADTQFHLIRDLSFYIAKKGGTAITLDYTGQVNSVSFPGKKLTLDRSSPRFLVENCFFRGAALLWDTGWDVGIDSIAAIKVRCSDAVLPDGRREVRPLQIAPSRSGSEGLTQATRMDTPASSWSRPARSTIRTLVLFSTAAKGVLSKTAISWVCFMESLLRMASVVHSSMCQTVISIATDARSWPEIARTAVGNLLYGVIDATVATAGITLRGTIPGGSNGFLILGNTFENTCSNKDFNCVIIENGSYGLINANIFRTNGAAIATAI